jgi:uncharacterized small protein (DUF1192 family)
MAFDPTSEDRPAPAPTAHAIGADLSALSVHELQERIGLLEAEIERLRAAVRAKEASKSAADAFFKR